jgi:two-component system response regulator
MTKNEVEILLVEDNPNDVELTLRAMKKHNIANKVHVVKDGAEARPEGALNHRPKLILLDLKLPKVDGLEVLHRIKGDKRAKAIPVVVLTSSREETDIAKSYEYGVNSYIAKPVDFDKFAKVVADLGFYWLLINVPPL